MSRSLAEYSDLSLVYAAFLDAGESREEALRALLDALGRVLGKSSEELVRALAGLDRPGLELVAELLRGAAERSPRPLVVVLDEAQNLLRALCGSLWSFVKVLSSVEEETGRARFIVVTSDYFFYERVLGEAPSLDYVETFYLGEMTREDAHQLYRETAGTTPEDRIPDALGGKPAHIIEAARSRDPREEDLRHGQEALHRSIPQDRPRHLQAKSYRKCSNQTYL